LTSAFPESARRATRLAPRNDSYAAGACLPLNASVRRGWRESSKRSSASVGADAPLRGVAVTPLRDVAQSHSRGRSRRDGGRGTGPLARYRLAPHRREITFGRHSSGPLRDCSNRESTRQRDAISARSTRCRRLQDAQGCPISRALGGHRSATAHLQSGGHARLPVLVRRARGEVVARHSRIALGRDWYGRLAGARPVARFERSGARRS
jgi:hypothetical protein